MVLTIFSMVLLSILFVGQVSRHLSSSVYSCLLLQVTGKLVDFESVGGIPDELSDRAAWTNGRLLNSTLGALEPGQFLYSIHVLLVYSHFVFRGYFPHPQQNLLYNGRDSGAGHRIRYFPAGGHHHV